MDEALAWEIAEILIEDGVDASTAFELAHEYAMNAIDQELVDEFEAGDRFEAIGGEVWLNVHKATKCGTEFCCIHNPSEHSMRTWRMHLRETGLVERICEHGVGHPDPDSMNYLNTCGPDGSRGSWGIHGCDGCCAS